jgi:hypothetical protein
LLNSYLISISRKVPDQENKSLTQIIKPERVVITQWAHEKNVALMARIEFRYGFSSMDADLAITTIECSICHNKDQYCVLVDMTQLFKVISQLPRRLITLDCFHHTRSSILYILEYILTLNIDLLSLQCFCPNYNLWT